MGDYPPEVEAEIRAVLEWLDQHPGAQWDEMPPTIRERYQCWRHIIRGEPDLTDNLGTLWTVPGLSSWGRLWLAKRATAPPDTGSSERSKSAGLASEPESKGSKKPNGSPNVSLDVKAVGVFLEHPDWTKKRIAEELGYHEKSLCPRRCPKLDAAIRAQRARIDPSVKVRRGSKDRDGNLEAWDEE